MKQDTKSALLASAETAARSLGFDGFSYADLAADVGIRKASIHHHFPTKANLSLELMRRYAEEFRRTRAEIDDLHSDGAARLAALIGLYRAAVGEGTSLCLCVSFSISAESLPGDVIVEMVRFRADMIAWIDAVFERGRADGTLVNLPAPAWSGVTVLAVLEGAQLAARAAQDLTRFDAALAGILASI